MSLKYRQILSVCGLFCFPIVCFYLLEAYTHNGFTEVRPWAQLFNILLYELMAWILIFALRSVKWALRIEGIFAMGIGFINYYVYTFRSLPLVPWDIFSIGTAASVAKHYDFTPEIRVVAVVAAFAAAWVFAGFLDLDIKKIKWRYSLPVSLFLSVLLVFFAQTLQNEDFQNRHQMYNKLFTPVYMWQVNGFALTMVMELPFMAIEKPEGYQKEAAAEVLESYEMSVQNELPENKKTPEQMPNIIVVMDEAFSDLSVLGEFTPSEDYMPYFHEMFLGAENTVSGYLNVSVCGGNTANTEFEFLTGNSMAFLPQGSIPFQQYIYSEIPALPAYLKELGYETYATHPYYASGWDRNKVYPLLGFSHMEFIEDYGSRKYVRSFISDESCVDKIIEIYEAREKEKPLFLFNVTMQNHGSYSEVYENFEPHITVEGSSSYSLSSYLSLIQKTDGALSDLISYFSEEKEPVMIVFFGDHQPNDVVAEPILQLNGKSYRTLSEQDTYLRYQVPYLIWTNYETETKTHMDTSVNYLGIEVLETAGIELPAYQKFLKELSFSWPVVSAARTEKAEDAVMELEEYQRLQYYQLFDVQE